MRFKGVFFNFFNSDFLHIFDLINTKALGFHKLVPWDVDNVADILFNNGGDGAADSAPLGDRNSLGESFRDQFLDPCHLRASVCAFLNLGVFLFIFLESLFFVVSFDRDLHLDGGRDDFLDFHRHFDFSLVGNLDGFDALSSDGLFVCIQVVPGVVDINVLFDNASSGVFRHVQPFHAFDFSNSTAFEFLCAGDLQTVGVQNRTRNFFDDMCLHRTDAHDTARSRRADSRSLDPGI